MRAAIGELELDQILHARGQLNVMIREAVQGAASAWGLEIKRYEITEIHPDKHITEAMDKQAAAERERRKKVLEAEGDKKAAELESEGQRIRLINESEGMRIQIQNEAEARRFQLEQEVEINLFIDGTRHNYVHVIQARGEAEAIKMRAEGQAKAIQLLAIELISDGKSEEERRLTLEAARLLLAKEVRQYRGVYFSLHCLICILLSNVTVCKHVRRNGQVEQHNDLFRTTC